MANYYGIGRTNYFTVKDEQAFLDEMAKYPVEVIDRPSQDERTLYGLMDSNQDGAGWQWSTFDEETDDEVEIDWVDVFARHLADNSVAILMETGSEKYRYMTGVAIAVNNKKETRELRLENIYTLAEELGKEITEVSY